MSFDEPEWLRLWRATLERREPESRILIEEVLIHVTIWLHCWGCPEENLSDVKQELMLHLFDKQMCVLRGYDPERGRFLTYMRIVARRKFLDSIRKANQGVGVLVGERDGGVTEQVPAPPQGDIRPNPGPPQALDETFEAIGKIESQKVRLCILLHFMGLKDREISEILDYPMGTVATRIRRGRKLLRDMGLCGEEPADDGLPRGNGKGRRGSGHDTAEDPSEKDRAADEDPPEGEDENDDEC